MDARARTVLPLFLTSFLGCSDGSSANPPGDGGTAGGDMTSSMTGSGTDGSTGTADLTAAAPDRRLDPLEIGRTWTYDVKSTYPSCPGGMRTKTVLGAVTVDGKAALEVEGICGYKTAVTQSGNVVESKYQTYPWMRTLDEPVAEGHTWMTTNGAATFGMKYSSAGQVTTPAGTFKDCWKVTQQVSYTQSWTYCPGVGEVSSTMIDLAGGTITYSLVKKNF